jgi:trans-aconitate methyltransferase
MEYDARYTAYQAGRSPLRKAIRNLYLRSAARQLRGPALDLGCGIGELLRRLPAGSKGLEYNKATVEHCRAKGLDVEWYDGYADGWKLSGICEQDGLRSLVISHVLEHLEDPMQVLRALLQSAARLKMARVVVIVPGKAGFLSDSTHLTFLDKAMLLSDAATRATGFGVTSSRYFPGDMRILGNILTHHELQVAYERSTFPNISRA